MPIKIDYDDYNHKVDAMEKATKRCQKSSKGFDIKFDSSKSSVVSDYSGTMKSIKSNLESFSTQMTEEVSKLRTVRDSLEKFDTSAFQNAMRLKRSCHGQ
jgi:uncharacterized membrane-anchored protein YjiN (DUF445 family)